jgi:DNA invertase Pin-like site-specific DNA recombinase
VPTLTAVALSLQQPFLDTTNGFGEVLLALFGWLAREERRLISERTKAGLKWARSQGKVLGRRPVKVDLATINKMRADGASVREIAKHTVEQGLKVRTSLQPSRRIRSGPSLFDHHPTSWQ